MTTQQINVRIPMMTQGQIDAVSEKYGLTKTQIVILAVDRLTRDLYPARPNPAALTEAAILAENGDETGYVEQA